MKATEILNKIKAELGMKVNLETQLLEDGVTTLEAEAFEAGKECFIVMEEEMVPLAVGEYTLQDGRALYVEQEGIIASCDEKLKEEEEEPEEPELNQQSMPKKVVETNTRETHFEEATPEGAVSSIESVEEEILGEVSAIVEELTPESVAESDASEIAVAVVQAVTETIVEIPEELKEKYMKRKTKYGKNKLSEEEAEIIAEVETQIIENVAEVVNAETPEEVTPEIAEEIAVVVAEVVQEVVAESPEELKKQLFTKVKLSRVKRKSSKSRIALAKQKIERIKLAEAKKKKADGKRIVRNPEKKSEHKVDFKISPNKKKTAMDRVMQKLFK